MTQVVRISATAIRRIPDSISRSCHSVSTARCRHSDSVPVDSSPDMSPAWARLMAVNCSCDRVNLPQGPLPAQGSSHA